MRATYDRQGRIDHVLDFLAGLVGLVHVSHSVYQPRLIGLLGGVAAECERSVVLCPWTLPLSDPLPAFV